MMFEIELALMLLVIVAGPPLLVWLALRVVAEILILADDAWLGFLKRRNRYLR